MKSIFDGTWIGTLVRDTWVHAKLSFRGAVMWAPHVAASSCFGTWILRHNLGYYYIIVIVFLGNSFSVSEILKCFRCQIFSLLTIIIFRNQKLEIPLNILHSNSYKIVYSNYQ